MQNRQDLAQDLELVLDTLEKFLDYTEFGCACRSSCQECEPEDTQCTGEFMEQAVEVCRDPLNRLRKYLLPAELPKAS